MIKMKIAYVSYEYPPDTAVGGIATYVYQASKTMKDRGHTVEVFCASPNRSGQTVIEGITVHHIRTNNTETFREEIVEYFTKRHQSIHFELIESPEYKGDGYYIKKRFPQLPLVVKLHTPDYILTQLHNRYKYLDKVPLRKKINYYLGSFLKGQIPKKLTRSYNKRLDIDYKITKAADQIQTPSISLGDIVAKDWSINRDKILNVPYPYVPTSEYLAIPIGGKNISVSYLGRLETRKGIVEFTKAIPQIVTAFPNVVINMVGRVYPSTIPNLDMKEYMISELGVYSNNLNFSSVSYTEIPNILAKTDVCVFPSLWENFPNVCLEAMSAGRAIVGSKQGGMKDMLENPKCGVLIDPVKSDDIAGAIINLLQDDELRKKLGAAAREKVLNAYSTEKIGRLTENYYQQLIKEAK
jgi:glycogen synthase